MISFRKFAVAALCGLSLTAYPRQGVNHYRPVVSAPSPASGMAWPQGQLLPHFATPDSVLTGFDFRGAELSAEERNMILALQGICNSRQPRIFLYQQASEGKDKWPSQLNLTIDEPYGKDYLPLVRRYAGDIKGIVLYSTEKSPHYINLASTVAGLEQALPVTPQLRDRLLAEGINLPIVADFTTLPYSRPQEIYQYLYDNYWPRCNHRLLVSLAPDFGYVRDLGVAAGSAIVWLDPRKWTEATVLRKFLGDMEPGESLVTGWYAEERSGIGLATEYGLSTVPSDFYENTTVYAGMNQQVAYPEVPKMPELENKIYVTLYLSDGDNVQYCQHAMSQLWDREGRGNLPINWTISPALVDFGPALLNHYYRTATPNDYFCSGPSGAGYALIYDSHNYLWNATSGAAYTPYTRLTGDYLEKSGLRSITIWDEVNQEQMDAYARNCRYLYGMTQQDWERRPYKVPAYIGGNTLPVVPNLPCYCNGVDVIYSFWKDTISSFDSSRPIFLSAQGESWKMGPDNILALRQQLEELAPGKVVICRGDHFFNLYNQANNLPFNLTLLPGMKITAGQNQATAGKATDGSAAEGNMWTGVNDGKPATVTLDFKQPYLISRYVMRHAGNAGLPSELNTRSFTVETSSDGKHWTEADRQTGNQSAVSDVDIIPAKARYVRFTILDPGADAIPRVADIEVYGTDINYFL